MIRAIAAKVGRARWFSGFVSLLERLPAGTNHLSVLTYHRIGDPAAAGPLYPGLISTTAQAFDDQMAHLAATRHLVSVEDVLAVREGRGTLPPRSTLVTFDDAYVDFAALAFPVLKKHAVPAVLFVPTAFPDDNDSSFWWDRLYASLQMADPPVRFASPAGPIDYPRRARLHDVFRRMVGIVKGMPHDDAMEWLDDVHRQLPPPGSLHAVLGWDALRQLAGEGLTLAAHSRTHPRLDHVSPEQLAFEVDQCRTDLKAKLGVAPPPVFAYPDGGHDAAVVRAVSNAGYRMAFTTMRGTNSIGRVDWLRMRRINIGQRTTMAILRAQLLAGISVRRRRVEVAGHGR